MPKCYRCHEAIISPEELGSDLFPEEYESYLNGQYIPLSRGDGIANEAIAGSLKGAGVDYRTNSLDNVSKANIGRGKLDDINGLEALVLSPDKQKDYCVEDCRLTLENCAKADSKTGSDWTIFRMLLYLQYTVS